MITWLNKQLNEKPGLHGSSMFSGAKYNAPTTTLGVSTSKPPVGINPSSTFKPSFASLDQLNTSSNVAMSSTGARNPSFERSPTRGTKLNNFNTPSSVSSIS